MKKEASYNEELKQFEMSMELEAIMKKKRLSGKR